MGHDESTEAGFQCARAAELLGHPKATTKDCKEHLPGLWRVVLTGGDLAEGWHEVKTFVWRAGERDTGTGSAALGAYLREADIMSKASLDPYTMQLLLEATAGAPDGFAPSDLGETLDGVAGGVRTQPFALVLVRRPPLHLPGAVPTPPGPPGGPSGGPPPGGPPPGGPPGGPPPGGGPGGGAPIQGVRRATLSAAGAQLQWLVEDRGPAPGAGWVEVSRETF